MKALQTITTESNKQNKTLKEESKMKALRTNISTTCSKVCETLTKDSFILGVVVLLVTIFMASQGFAFRTDNDELLNSVKPGKSLSATVLAQGDFNGDNVKDLVIGSSASGLGHSNCIEVRYGLKNSGLKYDFGDPDIPLGTATESQEICNTNYAGWNAGENFGAALAAGDFNGDGIDDLAIGAPHARVTGLFSAGKVYIIHGEKVVGLSADPQDHKELTSRDPQASANFGWSLATGQFSQNNGYNWSKRAGERTPHADLAIGAPGHRDVNGIESGAVFVIYGWFEYAHHSNYSWLVKSLDEAKLPGGWRETGDHYGESLAAGDFNNDGADDLAVSIPRENFGSTQDVGQIHIIYGGTYYDLSSRVNDWYQGREHNGARIEGGAEEDDFFGSVLATGDFNGDDTDDLVVGSPHEKIGSGNEDAGAINVLYGEAGSNYLSGGISAANNKMLWHNKLAAKSESYDYFGKALAVGDFNGDCIDDLAVGTPSESYEPGDAHWTCDVWPYPCVNGNGDYPIKKHGLVHVLNGSSSGLVTPGTQWTQDSTGVNGAIDASDSFGRSLVAGDFDGNGVADLAIGVPGDSGVNIFYSNNTSRVCSQ